MIILRKILTASVLTVLIFFVLNTIMYQIAFAMNKIKINLNLFEHFEIALLLILINLIIFTISFLIKYTCLITSFFILMGTIVTTYYLTSNISTEHEPNMSEIYYNTGQIYLPCWLKLFDHYLYFPMISSNIIIILVYYFSMKLTIKFHK